MYGFDVMTSDSVPSTQKGRGLNIYYPSQLQKVTGYTKDGDLINGEIARPYWYLSVDERNEIFKKCAFIFGVVTSRMNRIGSTDWTVVRKRKNEDRIVHELKCAAEIFNEYQGSGDLVHALIRFRAWNKCREHLPELKADFSNFNNALRRINQRWKIKSDDSCDEVVEWLNETSQGITFDDFRKTWVFDLMVHGANAKYKEYVSGRLQNIYHLPGGSVLKFSSKYVGGPNAYVQMLAGLMEPKIYFADEVAFDNYVPTSYGANGAVPLEALINKVVESMFFDQLMAITADGTKYPEKAVVFGENKNPFGDIGATDFDVPMNASEQKRIEAKLNEIKKNAIVTLTGVGQPIVLDLSKADTIPSQMERQDKLLRDIAIVFNMTNLEINLAGSEFTSGRETADSQREIELSKGIKPILAIMENRLNREILPYRFGWDYEFKFTENLSDEERVKLEQMKMQTGTYSVNEVRSARGDDQYPEAQYDRPQPPQQGGQQGGADLMAGF